MEREDSLEETIMGMATQLAEAEDTYIVEDLQSMTHIRITHPCDYYPLTPHH